MNSNEFLKLHFLWRGAYGRCVFLLLSVNAGYLSAAVCFCVRTSSVGAGVTGRVCLKAGRMPSFIRGPRRALPYAT